MSKHWNHASTGITTADPDQSKDPGNGDPAMTTRERS